MAVVGGGEGVRARRGAVTLRLSVRAVRQKHGTVSRFMAKTKFCVGTFSTGRRRTVLYFLYYPPTLCSRAFARPNGATAPLLSVLARCTAFAHRFSGAFFWTATRVLGMLTHGFDRQTYNVPPSRLAGRCVTCVVNIPLTLLSLADRLRTHRRCLVGNAGWFYHLPILRALFAMT